MLAIDGFDELYPGESCLADDTDLNWRFAAYGLILKPCKLAANMFHLYHETRNRKTINGDAEMKKMIDRKNKNLYTAGTGISSHKNN